MIYLWQFLAVMVGLIAGYNIGWTHGYKKQEDRINSLKQANKDHCAEIQRLREENRELNTLFKGCQDELIAMYADTDRVFKDQRGPSVNIKTFLGREVNYWVDLEAENKKLREEFGK